MFGAIKKFIFQKALQIGSKEAEKAVKEIPRSYRTTFWGVGVILTTLGYALVALFDEDGATKFDIGVIALGLQQGLGLIAARDQKAHEEEIKNGSNPDLRRLVQSFALAFLLWPAAAQAQNAVELGAAFYPSTAPRSAGYLTIVLGAGVTRSYTTMEMRPLSTSEAAYSTRSGIERRLFGDDRIEISSFAQLGVETSEAVGAARVFATGGVGQIRIRENLRISIAVEELNAETRQGWQPQFRVGLRYLIGSQ